jgi:beta-ribofuranosylaminobenzene 5'-phosphate synthase
MDRVTVTVPARLHLGFLDLNGGLGRKFGSLGLSISEPVTRLSLSRAPVSSVSGPESGRAAKHLDAMARHLGIDRPYALDIEEAMPGHSGLGSGTQLAMAVAAAVRRINGLAPDPAGDAAVLGRGARSGVGIGLFAAGGFAVDGGRGSGGAPAPIIAQLAWPEEWRVILLLDPRFTGVHGQAEIDAFAALPDFPEAEAARLCRIALMQMLPALAERDIAAFGPAVAEVQRRLGDHFASAQGGRFTSPAVGTAALALEKLGARGIGQSSWGPTGFAFAASQAEAERLVKEMPQAPGLDIRIVRGNNRGAIIEQRSKASVA